MKTYILALILILSLAFVPSCALQTAVISNADEAENFHPEQSRIDFENQLPEVGDSRFAPWLRAQFLSLLYVQVDGELVEFRDQRPVIVADRTFLPIRRVFEHMNFDVDWDPVNMQTTLISENYTVVLTIGSYEFTTNGRRHALDVPAQIVEGITMLPLNAVMKSIGYYVSWDNRSRAVLISRAPVTYVTIRGEQFSSALTGLNLSFKGFEPTNEDLALVAQLTNLTELSFDGAQITDLTPLANLTNLTSLSFGGARITDITPLANLTNLTELNLWQSQVQDLSPLANLTNLTWLNILGLQTADLTPLSGLTNLEHLFIRSSYIEDILPIEDITPFSGLTSLKELYLRNAKISDIAPLSELENLVMLNLSGNQISDLAPLANLPSLEMLSLHGNRIVDLTPLSNSTTLWALGLNANQISDLSPLASMTGLRSVHLHDNPITDWSPVEHVEGVSGRPE